MRIIKRAIAIGLCGVSLTAMLWTTGFGDRAAAAPQGAGALAHPDPTATASPEPTVPSETAEASATPEAFATPSPVLSIHDGDRADVVVVKYFEATMPDGLPMELKYSNYAAPLEYFVVMKSTQVRELPDAGAAGLKKVGLATRLPLLAEVKGTDGESTWYRVRLDDTVGYVISTAGSLRSFQVAKALEKVTALKQMADKGSTVRIDNYKNVHKQPPKLQDGKTTDPFGYVRDQSAPAYLVPDAQSSFRYAPDGILGQLLGMKGDFAEVYFPTFDEVRYVPAKFLETKDVSGKAEDVIGSLTQAVIVDRKNQNIIVFEFLSDHWAIVSMSYVSTGASGKFQRPTPVGDFFTKARPLGKYKLGEFWFLKDGADANVEGLQFEGYAPYGIRFCSGAYLHGLPKGVSYSADGQLQMPKSRTYESSTCLGTTPQSHMCVRNYTSHAKFMYEWVKDGSASVIVIE